MSKLLLRTKMENTWQRVSHGMSHLEKAAMIAAVLLIGAPILIAVTRIYPNLPQASYEAGDGITCSGNVYTFTGRNVVLHRIATSGGDNNPFNATLDRMRIAFNEGTADRHEFFNSLPDTYTIFTVATTSPPQVRNYQFIMDGPQVFERNAIYKLCSESWVSEFWQFRRAHFIVE